jgi:uncharacterized Fe-S cluster protein YjdI
MFKKINVMKGNLYNQYSSNWLGDEYTFYEDHTIKRVYDNHSLNSNKTEWLEPHQISKQNKDKLIRECPEELKNRLCRFWIILNKTLADLQIQQTDKDNHPPDQ